MSTVFYCQDETNNLHILDYGKDVLRVDRLNPGSTVFIDSVLKTVEYVPLELTDESIIGSINEIVVTKDYIIILDIYQTNSIYIFTRAGDFHGKIHRPGKGSGEYTQPVDIAMDPNTNEIVLLNGYPQKIIKYNLKGQFVGETLLPIRFRSLTVDSDGRIILKNEPQSRKYGNPAGHPNNIHSNLLVLTESGDQIELGGNLNITYEENAISNTNMGLMNNNEITFHPLFNDTIFELSSVFYEPMLVLDMGEHKIIENEVMGLSAYHFRRKCAENDYYYITGQHCITPTVISTFVYSGRQNNNYFVFYNRKTKEGMIFFVSKTSPYNPCNIVPKTAWKDQFVSVVSIPDLLELKEQLTNGSNPSESQLIFTPTLEILDRVHESSNPILAFYSLRPEKITMKTVYYE